MTLQVLVRDAAGVLVGLIEPTTIKAIRRFNKVGTWTLTVTLDDRSAPLLEVGSEILIRDRYGTFMSGPANTYKIVRGEDSIARVTVSGFSDEIALQDRLTYPDPPNAPTAQTVARHIVTGAVSTVLRTFVDVNTGPSARVERRSGLVLETPDPLLGPTITGATRFDNLLDLLQDLARRTTAFGMGFRVVRGITGAPEFQVFQPQDLTVSIRLAHGLNNLKSTDYSLTAPTATFVIGGGDGDGTARVVATADNPAAVTKWGRRIELFHDVRNEDDAVKLQADVDAQITEKDETGQVAFEALDTFQLQVRRDYDLGDSITVEIAAGVRVAQVIRELEVDQDTNGAVTYIPRVGDEGSTATPADRRLISDALRRIRGIEARQ